MKQKIEKYIELTKPKVTLLNLFVGITCFILAVFPAIDWLKLTVFIAVGYLSAGGCGVLNSIYDRDIDKLMSRTSKRAIPAGYIALNEALILGIAMVASSLIISYVAFNLLTVLMLALGLVFYLLIYTIWLKRTSPWNVVIGGFAGCFAAFSGWTAAANSLSLLPFLIAAIDFLWTPGHLWGLAINKIKEYKRVGIPMLPITAGLQKTSKIIFGFNVATISFSLMLPFVGAVSILYELFAISIGIWFLFETNNLYSFPTQTNGFRVFKVSMFYLTILMSAIVIDKIILIF